MTGKSREPGTSKPASTFFDAHAAAVGMALGNMFKAAGLQKEMVEHSAELARSMIDATRRTQQEITRMSFEAMSHGDPIAIMTLPPRAVQTGYREGMACAALVMQSAQSVGKSVLGINPETPTDGTDRS